MLKTSLQLQGATILMSFVILLGGCGKQNEGPAPQQVASKGRTSEAVSESLPVWEADPAVLEKLDVYQEIDNYQVRPPKGYPPVQGATSGPGTKHFGWGGTLRPDQTAPMFTIMITNTAPNKSLEALTQDLLGGIKRRRQDWQQSTFEKGRVNGFTFLRARWSGTESNKGWKMHGLIYVVRDGTNLVEISSQDVEPNDTEALKISDAAALTFKKK